MPISYFFRIFVAQFAIILKVKDKKMKKLLLTAFAFVLTVSTVMAVPAKRGIKKTLTLKDGTRVEATLTGDEHVNYYKTADGRALQRRGEVYQYVNLDSLVQLHSERLTARNKARAARRRVGTAPEGGYKGQKKGLVILVQFSDVKFTYDKATFNDYFNKVGFNQQGIHGSVHDYFLEQSYGQFDLEFDVVGPVNVGHNAYYYSTDNTRVATLVNNVCKQVDDEVDFSKYDWDNDGTVDQVYVIYAGYGAAQGADGTIWPHEWTVRAAGTQYTTAEGKKIDTYGISCELMGSSGSMLDGVGTSCHEFSHCLGLPDFYDTRENGSNFGMNVWDLMDYGCYNGDDNGHCPSGYTAYERWFAGWLTPTELYSSQQITDMPAIEDKPVAYIIYNDAEKNEYYLLANHQQKGFDEAQFGHGMLVLHVDYNAAAWTGNTVNNTTGHERMTIIPADNTRTSSTSSLAGDPFPGRGNKTALTDTSTPKATLYNANLSGEKLMGKPITDIDEVNGLITFNFMGGVAIDAPVSLEPSNVNLDTYSFTANWQPYSGAQKYTVSLRQVVASEDPWSFLMLGENFEKFENEVAGSTDISTKLDEYTNREGWDGKNLFLSPNRVRVGKASKPGRLVTPVLDAPSQESLSIMVTPLSASPKTEGELELRIMLASDTTQYASGNITGIPVASSEDAGLTWLMSMESWPYGPFRIGICTSGAGVYMNYLGVFDGQYSWDDFPTSDSAPGMSIKPRVKRIEINPDELVWNTPDGKAPVQKASAPRRAKKETITYYETTQTHYDFKNLEPASYYYKVRVTTAQGNSPWSEEQFVDLTNAIQTVNVDAPNPSTGRIYSLDGRQVSGHNLRPGIYIRDGKKFIVK